MLVWFDQSPKILGIIGRNRDPVLAADFLFSPNVTLRGSVIGSIETGFRRNMNKHFMIIVGLTLTFGSLAHADERKLPTKAVRVPAPSHVSTGPALPPQVMGQLDGILSYCKKIDPSDQDKYERLRRLVMASTSNKNAEVTEKNADYQASVELVQSVFSRMSANDALKLCKDAVK
jgi:hypothetical protein